MKTLTAIVFFIALYACSADDAEMVPVNDIYQGYRFEYNEASNETIIGAVFKAGSEDGEVIILSSPANFTVNDDFCNYQDSSDYPYILKYASRLPEAVLDFVDFERQEFINKVELDSIFPVKDFYAVVDSVSHEVKLSFTGEELCMGEELELIVSDGDKEIAYDVTGQENNVISINNDILDDFAGRTVCMKLCRVRNIDLSSASSAGGKIELVYASKIKEVELP